MKLGTLNAAIDVAPEVRVAFSFGEVVQQKGSLKARLKEMFDGRSVETNLLLTTDGLLQWEPDHVKRCGSCGAVL